MRKVKFLTLITLVLTLLAACTRIHAPLDISTTAEREVYKSHSRSASAFFLDTEGCVNTFVDIYASENGIKGPASTDELEGYFSFERYNVCTEETLLYVSGNLSDANFSIKKNLATATLTATELCTYDYETDTETCEDIALTATWTGVGKLTKSRFTEQFTSPTQIIRSRSMGKRRDASVTGNLSFGGETFALNAPTFDTIFAELSTGGYRFMIITKE